MKVKHFLASFEGRPSPPTELPVLHWFIDYWSITDLQIISRWQSCCCTLMWSIVLKHPDVWISRDEQVTRGGKRGVNDSHSCHGDRPDPHTHTYRWQQVQIRLPHVLLLVSMEFPLRGVSAHWLNKSSPRGDAACLLLRFSGDLHFHSLSSQHRTERMTDAGRDRQPIEPRSSFQDAQILSH